MEWHTLSTVRPQARCHVVGAGLIALILSALLVATPALLVAAPGPLVAAPGPLVAAPGRASADPSSIDDVHRMLGIDQVAADYVILVDISGSMQGPRYDAVRSGLRSFLAALAPQDQVSLVTFAVDAAVVWQGEAGRSPDTLVDRLPPEANGTNTDIGRALEKAVQLLSRDGAPSIATIVLLTDGVHEPRSGSPYPFENGYAWDQLRHAADQLKKDALTPYAVPLAGATGAHLLGKVFPGAAMLNPGAIDQVTSLLDQPKQMVQAAKARRLLGDDLTRGVAVQWPSEADDLRPGPNELTVVVRSTTTHIPLEVADLAVSSDRPDVTARVNIGSVTLEPGTSASIALTVMWEPGPASWKPFSTTSVRSTLTLLGHLGTPWAAALASDGASFAPELSGGKASAGGSAQNGRPWTWLLAVIAAALLVAMARVLVRNRLQPSMRGLLVANSSRADRTMMPLRGRKATLSKAATGIAGIGSVRRLRDGLLSRHTRVEITYTRTGLPDHRETKLCAPGESAVVSGVEFEWRPNGDTRRGPA